MRNLTHSLLLVLLAAAPAAAQDTTVMIQNKDCTVKVDGKRLPAAEEKKACERMRAATSRIQAQTVELQRQAERMSSDLARIQGRSAVQERAMAGQMRAVEEATRGATGAQIRLRSDLAERATAGRMAELDATSRLAEARAGVMERQMGELAASNARLAEARSLTGRAMVAIAARPRLGITIDTRARDTDKWGAYVSAVTPGGPADKGGVRSGDIIAKLAGKAVTGSGDETPGIKLIAMIGALEPNKTIAVQLRRGNDTKTVKVTPSDDDSFFAGPAIVMDTARRSFGMTFDTPSLARSRAGAQADMMRIIERSGDPLTSGSYQFVAVNGMGMGGPLASVEMTSLNAGLGSYFGATEGVLIINVGEKQDAGLQAGDVVTAVDGRKVTSPGQLARILRTYEKGEEYKLQIMRQKKTETVTGKMP